MESISLVDIIMILEQAGKPRTLRAFGLEVLPSAERGACQSRIQRLQDTLDGLVGNRILANWKMTSPVSATVTMDDLVAQALYQ